MLVAPTVQAQAPGPMSKGHAHLDGVTCIVKKPNIGALQLRAEFTCHASQSYLVEIELRSIANQSKA